MTTHLTTQDADGRRAATDVTEPIDSDQSLSQLMSRLSSDFGELVSTQVELAKVELKEEATRAGRSAAMLGAGTFVAYLALLLASFAAAWGLSEAMPTGFAFLIVAAVYGVVATVLLQEGRRRLTTVRGPVRTAETVKEDVQWARQQMS